MTESLYNNNGAAERIGLVVPRYGIDVVGGAEQLVRGLAEQLVNRGYITEVFTTCTNDMLEWNNYYESGTTTINGVLVRRFRTDDVDIGQVHRTARKAFAEVRVTYNEQLEFVRQSVNSQELYQYLRDHQDEFRCFIFAPYLFGTTYWGVRTVPDKALLLPCLHDEPFARFAIYRELLEQVRGVLFNTKAEGRFATEQLGMTNSNTAVVGYGFDPSMPRGDGERFRKKHNLPHETMVYVGRLQGGKNVPLLVDYFARYKNERPGPLTLALCGEGEVIQLARPDIVELGFLSDDEKNDAYEAAMVFCQPSVNESFSIVIMEAWLQDTPVIVHGDCAVTSEHVYLSGGGWTFRSYEEFRAVLDQMLNEPSIREARGRAGHQYVVNKYSWDAVTDRLIDGIERFTQPLSLREQLSRRGIQRVLEFSQERVEDLLGQVVARAESDLAQGLSHSQIDELRDAAHVSMPEYQVQSGAPVVGDLIATVRQNLTSHLREPYLDPIIERQEHYNKLLVDTLLPALERSLRSQQRLERQVRLLEQQVMQLKKEHNPTYLDPSPSDDT